MAEETTQAAFTENPLWETLSGFQAGRVYEVPDDTWMLGIGIGAANIVLDELQTHLADVYGTD